MSAGAKSLEISRTVHARPERVFAAWTEPDQIVQWWGPHGVTCTEAHVDLKPGGRYRLANRQPDGQVMWITGTYDRVEPPHLLQYTWTSEPITEDSDYSLVRVTFEECADGTLVTVSHTNISTATAREMYLGGWTGCLAGLDQLVSEGPDASEIL